MNLFAHHFRQHAVPTLRREISKQATLVCCEVREFDEAYDLICCLADKLGRWNLPRDKFTEINQWIMATLMQTVVETQPRIDEMDATNARRRIADPVAHYENLAASCTRPELMRWVFAGISPQYRAHLQAVRRERP